MNDTYSTREARIKLTDHCNYNCSFCHKEGGCIPPNDADGKILDLLDELKNQRRSDITFTGGEPLIKRALIEKAIASIARSGWRPQITVVTNASLLDKRFVDVLASYGNAKINASMHDVRPGQYASITGQTFATPGSIKPILEYVGKSTPVRLKLNVGMSTSLENPGAFDSLIAYAQDVHANAVKFVEIFDPNHPSKCTGMPADAMNLRLQKSGWRIIGENLRTTCWQKHGFGPVCEVSRCTCALGCSHCAEFRADFFTGAAAYHPCFISKRQIPLEGRSLESVLREGDEFVAQMAGGFPVAV